MSDPHDITGDMPDFLMRRQLSELANSLFSRDEWQQPTGVDDEVHQALSLLCEVGLIEMAIGLGDGVQIVLYKLSDAE